MICDRCYQSSIRNFDSCSMGRVTQIGGFGHVRKRSVICGRPPGFLPGDVPAAGEQEGETDQERHAAGNRVAVPETLDAPGKGDAQQHGKADAAGDPVQQRHGQVQPGVAGTVDQGEGRRTERAAQVLDHGDRNIHGDSRLNHGFIRREYTEEPFRTEQRDQREDTGGNGDNPERMADDFRNALCFFRAQGLGDHCAAGGGNRLGDHADHGFQLPGDAGDGDLLDMVPAEIIDIGIDEQHGEGDCRGLDDHGDAQGQQGADHGSADPEMGRPEIKMDLIPVAVEQRQGEEETGGLADDRRQGGAAGTQPHRADEQQVQDQVQHGGDGDEHERMLRVAHAAQDGGNEVVSVNEQGTVNAGDGILPGIFQDGIRRIQPGQDILIGEQEDDHDDHGQGGKQREERTHHFPDQVAPVFTDVAGDQDLSCVGETHGDKGDEHHHLAADGNGGKAFRTDHLANDDHVHHVVDHLEQAGEEQGHGKTEQRSRNAAGRQVADQFFSLAHLPAPQKVRTKQSPGLLYRPGFQLSTTGAEGDLFVQVEGAAADELPEQGERRDLVHQGFVHIRQIVQRLDQPAGQQVIRGIRGDLLQQVIGVELQNRELIVQRGIEHAVRVLLVCEDVFLFAAADAGPDGQRLLRLEAAELLVPHDTPQQADVGGADPVVVVQVQAGQGAGKDPVDLVGGELFDHLRVQAVDTFQDNDLARLQGGGRGQVILLAGLEIVTGHEDLFPVEQAGDRIRQEFHVQRVDGLKVPGAVQLDRQLIPVDEEIVHGDAAGGVPVHLQVHGEAGGKGSLAAGGGACHQGDMLVLLVDLPGNLVDGAFMQRFVHPDEIAEAAVLDHIADVADVGDAEDLAPVRALAENFEVLRPVDIRRGVVEVGAGGELQDETAPELKEREDRHISGGYGHGAVEVFPHAVDGVHGDGGHGAAGEQFHLVRLALLLEIPDGVLPAPLLPGEDQVQGHKAAHFIFQFDDILPVQFEPGQADEDAVSYGIFDPDLLIGEEVTQGQQHHETQGALIDAAAFLVLQGQGRQVAVAAERIVQLADHAAGQGRQRAAGKRVQRLEAVLHGGAFREFLLVVHGTDNHGASSFGFNRRACWTYRHSAALHLDREERRAPPGSGPAAPSSGAVWYARKPRWLRWRGLWNGKGLFCRPHRSGNEGGSGSFRDFYIWPQRYIYRHSA